MRDTFYDEQADPASEQAAEMVRGFQAAVLAASDELLHLSNALHYVYGAAIAGRGELLKSALKGQDVLVQAYFEEVLAIFRRRNFPILEEYTKLLPFILETLTGIKEATQNDDDGQYLRDVLGTHDELSLLLENLVPTVRKIVRQPSEEKDKRVGRPRDVVNHYLGRKAGELKAKYHVNWADVLDLMITDLSKGQKGTLEEEALQRLLALKVRANRQRIATHLRNWAERYEIAQI